MGYLPQGYKELQPVKKYWKTSEMKEGDTKLRIVIAPIAGWVYWKDKKPIRSTPGFKPKVVGDENQPKAFWTCYVWDYEREDLFVLEITQVGIIKALTGFAEDPDWGDFTKYDIKITKTGSLLKTKYTVTALPHKPFSDKLEDALEVSPVRLEALFDGGDPWKDLEAPEKPSEDKIIPIAIVESSTSSKETLKIHLVKEDCQLDHLDSFLAKCAKTSKCSEEKVIENAFLPGMLPRFVAAYSKHCSE